jgi:hypothetical protein
MALRNNSIVILFLFIFSTLIMQSTYGQENTFALRIPMTIKVCGEYFSPKNFKIALIDTKDDSVVGSSILSKSTGIAEFVLNRKVTEEKMRFIIYPSNVGYDQGEISFDSLLKISKIEVEIKKLLFSKNEGINNVTSDLHYLAEIHFIDQNYHKRSSHFSLEYEFWEKDIRKIFKKAKPLNCEYLIFEGFKILCH